MKVNTSEDCRLITVDAPQLSDLFRGGLVQDINVKLTYNCCDSYEFTISSDTSNCVWTSYGDYLASDIDVYPVTFTGICGIRIDSWDGSSSTPLFPIGPLGDISCDDCYDLSDPTGREQLVTDVNAWLAANGGGQFNISMSNGVSNTPYEQSLGAGSVFTLTFVDLADGLTPRLWQSGGSKCGNPSGGYYSIADFFFTCGGLSSNDFVFSENQIKIRPTVMGKSVFPDGVYGIEVEAVSSDGTKTSINECFFMDCELSCKVLASGNMDAFLTYYILNETSTCDCDCKTLCDFLKLTYK